MKKFTLVFLLTGLSFLFGNDLKNHSLQLKAGSGRGILIPAEFGQEDRIALTGNFFQNFNSSSSGVFYPIPRTQIKGQSIATPNLIGLEYRFKENLRISIEGRSIENFSPKFQTSLYPDLPLPIDSSKYNWNEKAFRGGISKYFSLNPFLSFGLSLRYHSTDQNFQKTMNKIAIRNREFESTQIVESETETGNFKFRGAVPGLGLEIKPISFLTLGGNLEFIQLNGNLRSTKKLYDSYTLDLLAPYVQGRELVLENSQMNVSGSIMNVYADIHPFSFLHIKIGYTSETYRRKFLTYNINTNRQIDFSEVIIRESLYKNIFGKYKFNFPYIEASFRFEF
jgi:hypothetical protein